MLTIRIGGQDRPIHVGTNQGDTYCRLQNLTLAEYAAAFSDLSKLGLGAQRDFLYSALKAGADKYGTVFNATPLEVGDWIDEPDYVAAETIGVVIRELGDQFARKQAFQAERAAKNVPAPESGAAAPALTVAP